MSSRSVACPHCSRTFGYHPNHAGLVVTCQGCGGQLQLPADSNDFEEISVSKRRSLPSYAAAEPWYYGFLETYIRFFTWLAVAVVAIAALVGIAFFAFVYSNLRGTDSAVAGVFLFLYLIWLVLLLCGFLFWAALVLLAVDAGRSLRKIVAQTRK